MKTTTLLLILFLTGLNLWAQVPPAPAAPAAAPSAATASNNSNLNGGGADTVPYEFNFQGVDVKQVLKIYSGLVGRTLLMAQVPQASIILVTQSPLTKSEAIEALQAVLALNGIELVPIGDKFVKVVGPGDAGAQGGKIDTSDASQLPDLGPYVTHIVHMNYVKPSAMQAIIAPFAKLAGAITPLDDNGILVLRDHAENVKRMLELIAQVDVGGGESEIISEVIPIRYALAQDIASALTSLGGSGNATVSIGSSSGAPVGGNGIARPAGGIGGGIGSQPGGNNYSGTQPRTLGIGSTTTGTTPNGTPATGTGTFQSRLLSIVNNAAQSGGAGGKQEPIQIFGQTKIIADQRSNSLLVFATRSDMDAITNVIAKLDVLLSQVLIESVIIDVDLNKAMNMGASVAQNPSKLSPGGSILGAGGYNNGQSFYNFANGLLGASNTTTSAGSAFGNSLSSGFSYFGNIGPTFDVAVQAAANDSSATVIQRPRIQTSQAKAAAFFVGQTVPYVTGSTYGSAYGNSSSYSQLSVGVSLQVTPFINPDGLVVMDIDQEIDDLNGTTHIDNVGDVPNTTKRTLNSEIAVKDKDTIMLGGFIRSDKSNAKSGVPYLQDIPLLGYLFSQHTSKKDRQETIVLIRPTVLRTPDIASAQAVIEQSRLPGVTHAVIEDASDERKQIESEAKAEADAAIAAQKGSKSKADDSSGFFKPVPAPSKLVDTNAVASPHP